MRDMQAWMEQRHFLGWLRRQIPVRYQKIKATDGCFSPAEHFDAISDFSLPNKKAKLIISNHKLAAFIAHLLGNGECHCTRCLRILNARAIYLVRYHSELFTEACHKVVWMELFQRNKEHQAELQNGQHYKSDGLFLLYAKAPYRGCPSVQDNHILFFDKYSLWHGMGVFQRRIAEHPHLAKEYVGLKDLAEFDEPRDYRFPGLKTRFFAASSQRFSSHGSCTRQTVVDIVAKRLG